MADAGPAIDQTQSEWTIGDVAEMLNRSVHTLRFYESQGLLPDIRRTAGGRRIYSSSDLEWLTMCLNLRATGMPIPAIRRYVELASSDGDDQALAELLIAHRETINAQIHQLGSCLDMVNHKIESYTNPGQNSCELQPSPGKH